MRILLTANAPYAPPRGGSTRSNLTWLDELTGAGHECRVVAAAAPENNASTEQLRSELAAQDVQPLPSSAGIEAVERGGIRILSVTDPARRTEVLRSQIHEFNPGWVLVSSEDVGHLLIREAHRSLPGRVVYLAHTPQFYPFGPASWNRDPEAARLVAQSAGVIAIGRKTGAYVEQHAGCPCSVIHPPMYGPGPFPRFGRADANGFVTMINPCAIKGISIFESLAEALPELAFAALPSWGTTARDRSRLEPLTNVMLLQPRREIDQILSTTRILLMPSLWLEGFGLIVMEAMLRGIPVISSDSGGLVEAKMGTGFVIPVRPIEQYEPEFDEHHIPRAIVPKQDVEPWIDAVKQLTSDPALYNQESEAALAAAHQFIAELKPGALGQFLSGLEPAGREQADAPQSGALEDQLAKLSPEKRALFLQRLRTRTRNPVKPN